MTQTYPHVNSVTSLVKNQYYWVPCVQSALGYYFPFLGKLDKDQELTGNQLHVHADSRFFELKLLKKIGLTKDVDLKSLVSDFRHGRSGILFIISNMSMVKFVKRLLRCRRTKFQHQNIASVNNISIDMHEWGNFVRSRIKSHNLKANCMRCPHKGAYLGNVPAKDGVIQCPNHGLKYDEQTGECLNSPEVSQRVSDVIGLNSFSASLYDLYRK